MMPYFFAKTVLFESNSTELFIPWALVVRQSPKAVGPPKMHVRCTWRSRVQGMYISIVHLYREPLPTQYYCMVLHGKNV